MGGEEPGEKQALYDAQEPFVARLAEIGGTIRGGAELHASTTGRSRSRPGATKATDGPFTEWAEQIGGFLDVDCDDFKARCLSTAATLLTTAGETVEVRRVVTDEEREGRAVLMAGGPPGLPRGSCAGSARRVVDPGIRRPSWQ